MNAAPRGPTAPSPRSPVLGGLLLVNFAVVVVAKIALGRPQELAWMSHVGLLVAALGFLRGANLLLATAFVSLASLHGIWLVDAAGGLLLGAFPLGATRYLAQAGPWAWLSTLHHFYLLPLLAVVVYRRRYCPGTAYVGAVALYLYLSILSRAFLEPADNVNFAFGVEVHVARPFLDWANRQAGWLYLLGLNTFVALVLLLPPFLLARHGIRRRPAAPHEAPRATFCRAARA